MRVGGLPWNLPMFKGSQFTNLNGMLKHIREQLAEQQEEVNRVRNQFEEEASHHVVKK